MADCICLMSLDKVGAIPVDTHVWQIALQDYKLKKISSVKSLNATNYKAIGDLFRSIFGEYAGWAHSVLFAADLKQFKEYGIEVEAAMKDFTKEALKESFEQGPAMKKMKLEEKEEWDDLLF